MNRSINKSLNAQNSLRAVESHDKELIGLLLPRFSCRPLVHITELFSILISTDAAGTRKSTFHPGYSGAGLLRGPGSTVCTAQSFPHARWGRCTRGGHTQSAPIIMNTLHGGLSTETIKRGSLLISRKYCGLYFLQMQQ